VSLASAGCARREPEAQKRKDVPEFIQGQWVPVLLFTEQPQALPGSTSNSSSDIRKDFDLGKSVSFYDPQFLQL
jgi:hypothetical protein